MPKVTYLKPVSDHHIKAVLQRMADFFGKDISVHSGDRSYVPSGGSTKSLHLAKRAADFHIAGLSDAKAFKSLKEHVAEVFEPSEGYELIIHGVYTQTGGPHLHIGHYLNKNQGLVLFKTEGLVQKTRGDYDVEPHAIGKPTASKPQPQKNPPAQQPPPPPVKNPPPIKTSSPAKTGSEPLISASVGASGKNVRDDVLKVQTLLNRARRGTYPGGKAISALYEALAEDGVCGPKTLSAIRAFQKHVAGFALPDGRVDPDGRTLKMLAAFTQDKPGTPSTPLSDIKQQLEDAKHVNITAESKASVLVDDPRIRAMLDVLAFTEGTGDDYGKVVNGTVVKSAIYPQYFGKKNVSITDLSRHPEIFVRWATGQPLSSAAGRYQFLSSTWEALGMPDFSKRSQDIGAVKLMKQRKMIAPLLSGNLELAVFKGAPEWASLPKNAKNEGYYSGQSAKTLAQIKKKYAEALAKFQGSSKKVA